MTVNRELAKDFAAAHTSGEMLVLPTVWDVWSARLCVDAGFKGLTIGSHPVADAIGAEDGEAMDFGQYLAITRRIVDSVDVPVSVDVESGYGLPGAELARQVIAVGAVGLNIEDTVHREGKRVRTLTEHADYIAAVRAEADRQEVELVINGRTDALKHGTAEFEDPEGEATRRIQAMVEAGARAVYPVAATQPDLIRRLVASTDVPVNVTVDPVDDAPADRETLRSLGVRRLTWGPRWQAQMRAVLIDSVSDWT